jgi:uncharacterized OsmC-like protein
MNILAKNIETTTSNSLNNYPEFMDKVKQSQSVNIKERHQGLYQKYADQPETAMITDGARTSSELVSTTDPIHTEINFGVHNPISLPVGLHTAVGGDSDFPNPGDILCGAIAGCLDGTLRMICNRLGIKIKKLQVEVKGRVDTRGTLKADESVPVGFQHFDVAVTLKPKGFVPGLMLNKILQAAEHSCVVIQSLRSMPQIHITRT